MSKFRAAAVGAAIFIGTAVTAAAQAPEKADSVRPRAGVRGDRIEGRRMDRGMRQGQMRRRMHAGKHRGMRHGDLGRGTRRGQFGPGARGRFGADLNLTDAQKTRVKAIQEKYAPQFKALNDQSRTQMQSLRDARQRGDTSAAARQRFTQQREQFRQRAATIRQQQQNEIRGVLTPEQRTKSDAVRAEHAKRLEERAKQLQDQAKSLREGRS